MKTLLQLYPDLEKRVKEYSEFQALKEFYQHETENYLDSKIKNIISIDFKEESQTIKQLVEFLETNSNKQFNIKTREINSDISLLKILKAIKMNKKLEGELNKPKSFSVRQFCCCCNLRINFFFIN